jgi:glutathione S-transferase
MYILYHFQFSQHARRVVSLLVAAGLDHELRMVDMGKRQHLSPEYLSINPNHQVPTLLDGAFKLHESNAILRYLCTKHRLTQWYPEPIEERASVEQWLDWNQCRLSPAVVDIVLNSVFLGDAGDRAAIDRGRSKLSELMPLLESALGEHAFLIGAEPTIADLSVASNIFQLTLAEIEPDSPNVQRWFGQMRELPGFRQSLPPSLNHD